jgi:Protein of unknown function (DUF3429)
VILPTIASAEFDEPVAIPRTIQILGAAGMVPFAAAAIGVWTSGALISPPDSYLAGVTYGAVALSFMGGARWGAAFDRTARGLLIGLAPPLAGWVALLLSPLLGLCLLIAAFFLQAFSNVVSAEKGVLPEWFGKFSSLVTSGAVVALLAMLLRLLT